MGEGERKERGRAECESDKEEDKRCFKIGSIDPGKTQKKRSTRLMLLRVSGTQTGRRARAITVSEEARKRA